MILYDRSTKSQHDYRGGCRNHASVENLYRDQQTVLKKRMQIISFNHGICQLLFIQFPTSLINRRKVTIIHLNRHQLVCELPLAVGLLVYISKMQQKKSIHPLSSTYACQGCSGGLSLSQLPVKVISQNKRKKQEAHIKAHIYPVCL